MEKRLSQIHMKTLSCRLKDSDKKEIDSFCSNSGLTKSQLLRSLLENFLIKANDRDNKN